MSFQRLGVVTSVPGTGTPPGTGTALQALKVDLGNVLEITGLNTGGAGTGTLLRWFGPPQNPGPPGFASSINVAGEWRVWREDSPIQLAAVFSGRYELPRDQTEYWLLYIQQTGDSAPIVSADAQGVYYRGGP